MRRLLSISALLLFGFVSVAFAKKVTLRGFVTAVHSPKNFEMDEYQIIDDTDAQPPRLDGDGKVADHPPQLRPGSLRVGLEVEVKGDYDRKTGEVKASAIKALWDESDEATPVEGMGLVEETNDLRKSAQGWSGSLSADGEKLIVTPSTRISVKHSRAERKELQNAGRETADDALFSPDDIGLDTFAHYVGVRLADHSMLAKTIEFRQDRAAAESDWSDLAAKIFYPEPNSEVGTLTVGETKYETFPSPEGEDYLSRIGESLIPVHQRELAAKSPGKIQFRFFLVNTDSFDIDAYPNGVIVVSAQVLDVLDNEGQFAFVLAHEMASVVEKQAWTLSHYRRTERMEIAGASGAASLWLPGAGMAGLLADKGIEHGFIRSLQNQADRIGIEYMLAAGYDPNQAAEAWRVLEKKRAQGRFWGNHDINFMRRTYLESELQLSYPNRDFSALKRDSPDFHAAVDAVKATRHRAKTKKR